jgi:hypothetical protein
MRLATSVIGVAGYALAGLAAISLLLGIFLARNSLAFAADTRDTTGRVMGYSETPSNAGVRYTPLIEFTDAAGTRREFHGQMNTSTRRFAIGAIVPVRYLLHDPSEARVTLFVDNWLGAVVAFVLGTVAGAGAFLLVRSTKRELAQGA